MKLYKKNRFAMAAIALGCAGFMFTACGDDSSSAEEPVSDVFSLKDSFDIIVDMADYQYNSKDSSFKLIKPVCKTGKLGNLVGPNDAVEWDTLSYKAYANKGTITLKDKESTQKFSISEKTFPVGFWADPKAETQNIQNGYVVSKTQMNSAFRYTGSCLVKDFLGQFRKGNPALSEADEVLTGFYGKFMSGVESDDEDDSFDIRMGDCDELTMFDALVSVKLSDFKKSSGKLTVSFDTRSCPIEFSLRYAYNQADCQAAFADFEDDRKADKVFDFDKYSRDVSYDEYCIARLILDLKETKKIPLKARAEENSADFANAMVDLVLDVLLK